ncbi:MAG: hypothetical protein WAU47_01515 [Desulfobaccales bacterium]
MNSVPDATGDFNGILRPKNIFKEVKTIVLLIFQDFNFEPLRSVYHDIVKLFKGEYIGYLKCDTGYHDLRHTQECFLEMARLIHGTMLNGHSFSKEEVNLGLISAMMHDTGYIKSVKESSENGGKFTLIHIDRSIQFMKKYLKQRKYSSFDIKFCENCLKCTGLSVKINKIKFNSLENGQMGKILGTADLIGQMANPLYLKKLPILFQEFQEAGLTLYSDEFDFLKKTPGFWEFTKERFTNELGGMDRYLQDHFRVRWGIDRDLDREAVEKNITYLNYILEHHPKDYRRFLKGQGSAVADKDQTAACPP